MQSIHTLVIGLKTCFVSFLTNSDEIIETNYKSDKINFKSHLFIDFFPFIPISIFQIIFIFNRYIDIFFQRYRKEAQKMFLLLWHWNDFCFYTIATRKRIWKKEKKNIYTWTIHAVRRMKKSQKKVFICSLYVSYTKDEEK